MASEFNGLWAVITSEGRSYIGKVTAAWVRSNPYSGSTEPTAALVLEAERVTLCPAYDYFSPLRPVQQPGGAVGFSRDPVVTPFEFALEDVPVHVKVGTLMLFDDLKPNDRRTYQAFVEAADKQKEAARLQRSGLVLPEGNNKR